MEKLSLEKFDKSKLTKDKLLNIRGGADANEPTEGGIYWTIVGDCAAGDSYDSDIAHDQRYTQISWVSTDMQVADLA